MIRSLLLAVFVTTAVSSFGEVHTIIGEVKQQVYIVEIPAGKVLEILGFAGGPNWTFDGPNALFVSYERHPDGRLARPSRITDYPDSGNRRDNGATFCSNKVLVKQVAGPAFLQMVVVQGSPVLTYKLTDNLTSKVSKPASPKADDIKLTDEFLMLDYTVQANTTYKLGISKDLKNWQPLFEFTPESDKLNVELPKIILGNESYLKLE